MKRLKSMWLIYKGCQDRWAFQYAYAITFLFITTPASMQNGTWPTDPRLPLLLAILLLPMSLFTAIVVDLFNNRGLPQ